LGEWGKIFCPKCGSEQRPYGRYCISCGASAAEVKDLVSRSMQFEMPTGSPEGANGYESEISPNIVNRQEELKSVESKIGQSNGLVRELENTISGLGTQKRQLESANSSLLKRNQEMYRLFQDTRRKRSELEAKLRSDENTVAGLADQKHKFESANFSLVDQNRELDKVLQDKIRQQSDLVDRNREMEKQLEEKRKRQSELGAKLKAVQSEIEEFNTSVRGLQNAVGNLENQKHELQIANSSLTDRNELLDRMIQDKQQQQLELDVKVKSAGDRVRELENAIATLASQKRDFEYANSSLTKQYQEMEKLIQDKSKQQSELEAKLKSDENIIANLPNQTRGIERSMTKPKYRSALPTGSLVRCERDSYTLTRKISTGGMGMVWEGKSRLGRCVVVKEPLINNDHDEIKIDRLMIEAEVLRSLNDELAGSRIEEPIRNHVVRYLDQLRDPSHPFLVTEYLSGDTASHMFARKPLAESIAMRQILTLLDTVEAIHLKAVIHRDISPSNIILDAERGVVLIDFGASIMLRGERDSRSKEIGRVVFKKGFSAPELLEMRSDMRSDLFSVGATLFYFLAGRNPADFAHSPAEGLEKFPTEVKSRISRTCFEVIETAMSSNPANRFQSAAAMIKAIESIIKDTAAPTLRISGQLYELRPDFVDVGRVHECGTDCRSQGYTKPVQVRILDHQNFIEKHHARIWVEQSGRCSIEDLRSVNGTAVKHMKSTFRVLSSSAREVLQDGDFVALAYSRERGPYLTFAFDAGVRTHRKA